MENISDAVYDVRPSGVDVSSGIETRGMKDGEKMLSFVRFAKRLGRVLEGEEDAEALYGKEHGSKPLPGKASCDRCVASYQRQRIDTAE